MPTLPAELRAILMPFGGLFSVRVFTPIQVLLAGAILAPGQRTVCSCLRAMGLESAPDFQKYHRLLNRVGWSPRGHFDLVAPVGAAPIGVALGARWPDCLGLR